MRRLAGDVATGGATLICTSRTDSSLSLMLQTGLSTCRTMAARLAELGHSVTVGTRDPAATTARTEPDGMGNPPFATWHAEHPDVTLATFEQAARHGDCLLYTSDAADEEDSVD